MNWATVVYMNMGETRAIARYSSAEEALQHPPASPRERDVVIVTAKSNISFLSVSALDGIMRQFGDKRLGIKKERKEVVVRNWLSRFVVENHDRQTGKLINAYEEEDEMNTNETPNPNGERSPDEVVEGVSEESAEEVTEGTGETEQTTTEESQTGTESGEDELAAVVKRIAKKKRAAAASDDDSTSTTEDKKVATKKTAKKKGKTSTKTTAAAKVPKKKAAGGNGAKKGFPYPVPDPESKCGKVLAFLNEQIKKKDIAENEKAEKAELFEAAAKKFETKVITIRTYASDHRDKLKWRAASKKKD